MDSNESKFEVVMKMNYTNNMLSYFFAINNTKYRNLNLNLQQKPPFYIHLGYSHFYVLSDLSSFNPHTHEVIQVIMEIKDPHRYIFY